MKPNILIEPAQAYSKAFEAKVQKLLPKGVEEFTCWDLSLKFVKQGIYKLTATYFVVSVGRTKREVTVSRIVDASFRDEWEDSKHSPHKTNNLHKRLYLEFIEDNLEAFRGSEQDLLKVELADLLDKYGAQIRYDCMEDSLVIEMEGEDIFSSGLDYEITSGSLRNLNK